MLIVTTRVLPTIAACTLAGVWPGPKVLIVLPESGISEADLRALPDDFVAIDYLEDPGGVLRIFQDLIEFAGHLFDSLDFPVLFLNSPTSSEGIASQIHACAGLSTEIEAEFSDEGHITVLRLGDMVATNPLLLDFFDFLGGRPLEDQTFNELLQDAFSWNNG